ncbi:sigma-70 family RNA polymerase sigma factor [Gloeocapsopsis crepidinum LEGE 06123]|uniref:Sigma-70 family RNA polymerase sigma factor n=1 Tax=Gloeocapsopsis crepidinum LEGE 06123 TaxID=588587 RepID=A0ABR9UP44_9CHRO|nr:sigma-70 family RNA polymerase sigma factor [Gloeocapsopsis crepidinum]MBE9190054.1 sigma-70 family RNA polymerase sigma factor [Gloeocapsopsis crepidinum LEGE 06123]
MPSEQPGNTEKLIQTDVELYRALQAGQDVALGILYDRHAGLVYGIALKILGHPQEAEDLTQDVFLKLAQSSSYDPSRGSLRTFLAILTRSRAIDRVRSRSKAREFFGQWRDSEAEHVTDSLFEQVFRSEQSQEVQAALSQLSDTQQQILHMAYYDGLSQSEIAKQLEIPLGTVKARARRGLLKLRQTLTDYIR